MSPNLPQLLAGYWSPNGNLIDLCVDAEGGFYTVQGVLPDGSDIAVSADAARMHYDYAAEHGRVFGPWPGGEQT